MSGTGSGPGLGRPLPAARILDDERAAVGVRQRAEAEAGRRDERYRAAVETRDALLRMRHDEGPVLAEAEGPNGWQWWTATHVLRVLDAGRGEQVILPRNPPD